MPQGRERPDSIDLRFRQDRKDLGVAFERIVYEIRSHCCSLTTPRKRRHSAMPPQISSDYWPLLSHAARLDTVEDGIVPVSVEPCDFRVRVETQNVAMRDVYVLALLCNARHFGGDRPAHFGLDDHCVPLGGDQLDHFDSEVRN